jgi:hypothetical protein
MVKPLEQSKELAVISVLLPPTLQEEDRVVLAALHASVSLPSPIVSVNEIVPVPQSATEPV